jgi:hypothetical protein
MPILAMIRHSKLKAGAILVLALALLNGMFSQAYGPVPLPEPLQSSVAAHSQHHAGQDDATHQQPAHADCLGSDAVCKTKCAWSCQLSQAMPVVASPLSIETRFSMELPAYFPSVNLISYLDIGLRPPITA